MQALSLAPLGAAPVLLASLWVPGSIAYLQCLEKPCVSAELKAVSQGIVHGRASLCGNLVSAAVAALLHLAVAPSQPGFRQMVLGLPGSSSKLIRKMSCSGVLSSGCLMLHELLVCSSWVPPGRPLRYHTVVAVSFQHPPQTARDWDFFLCPAFLEGPGLDRWVGCGWAHGMGTGYVPLAPSTAPTYPYVASARGADLLLQRELCHSGVFYDRYLDESQLHCGVMLIIVSTKLDLLAPPTSPPAPAFCY